jgi:hypothetical protein
MTYDEACKEIVKNREVKALNYAVNYAKAGIGMVGEERRVQAIYILSNMSGWRGDVAKEVRAALNEVLK